MLPTDVEAWALLVVDRVRSGEPVDDDRVGLIVDWPEPAAGARLLAGHANAARMAPILWLVGVDEEKGKVGTASDRDAAGWVSQVMARFDEGPPEVVHGPLEVAAGRSATVTAFAFDASRPPYVVATSGGGGDGDVEREVPWRDADGTRSARHSDLVRMLHPLVRRPTFEVLSGSLDVSPVVEDPEIGESHATCRSQVELYVESPVGEAVVIPEHRSSAVLTVGRRDPVTMARVSLVPVAATDAGLFPVAQDTSRLDTVTAGEHQLILRGPGRVELQCEAQAPPSLRRSPAPKTAELRVEVCPIADEPPTTLALRFEDPVEEESGSWRWHLAP